MPEEDAILESIEESVQSGIKRAQGDNGHSMEEHSLPDRIAADKYRRSLESSRRGIGIRYVKFVPPGTV